MAQALSRVDAVLYATGNDFPDALAAGAAAAHLHGAVLLTNGTAVAEATRAYAATVTGRVYAVGGAAARAVLGAVPLAGTDRYGTAMAVAEALFPTPTRIGLASGAGYPDALAGGAQMALLDGPVLLVRRSELVPAAYVRAHRETIGAVYTYGGPAVIDESVGRAARRRVAASGTP